MNDLKKAKETYSNIKIPKELEDTVSVMLKKNKPKNKFRYAYSTAAGLLLFILVGVNVSETFALNFSKIPLIGNIVSIVSIHGKKIDNDKTINTEIPKISSESENENLKSTTDKINEEIQSIVDEYTKEAEKNIEEYKKAFIETGGTEKEFEEKNIAVDVSYDIKSESENHLSLILKANENWMNAHNVSYFYNIDLNTGNNISLEDILGDDYINIANNSIKSQIEEQIAKDENVAYFGYGDSNKDIDGFKTITDETNFYINKDGNPVIVFQKYEIAPGFMGEVEFEIKK